ncbi:hypothetical protein FWH58_03255 [Candidatus Saccharibacteria bacterium]|nr:hypothetical protein [Candidatus Saccharibacteria bacterium]
MKKSDWALIILIVGVVAVVSWFVIGSILPPPADETVKTAPLITSSIQVPENNVILHDADRPNWCPKGSIAVDDEGDDFGNVDGKQYINSVFNSCAINSSFTTTTE